MIEIDDGCEGTAWWTCDEVDSAPDDVKVFADPAGGES